MSAFARIRRYAGLEEARVVWAFLRSAGIDAELDHHEASSNLIWGGAWGAEIRVPRTQAEDAIAAMREVHGDAFAIPDVEPIPRGWGNMAKGVFLLVWLTGLPVYALIVLLSLAIA